MHPGSLTALFIFHHSFQDLPPSSSGDSNRVREPSNKPPGAGQSLRSACPGGAPKVAVVQCRSELFNTVSLQRTFSSLYLISQELP